MIATQVRLRFGIVVLSALMSNAAFAGGYARGYGETVTEATENALRAAEVAVASRANNRGCVGPGKDGQPGMVYKGKEDGLHVMEAHYNHTAGACGQKKSVGDYIKELGL
jgi:hypothetical protein